MPENENEVMTTEVMTTDTDDQNENGGAIAVLFGFAFVGGVAAYKGLSWIGRKIFRKKQYAEVDKVTIVKDK